MELCQVVIPSVDFLRAGALPEARRWCRGGGGISDDFVRVFMEFFNRDLWVFTRVFRCFQFFCCFSGDF